MVFQFRGKDINLIAAVMIGARVPSNEQPPLHDGCGGRGEFEYGTIELVLNEDTRKNCIKVNGRECDSGKDKCLPYWWTGMKYRVIGKLGECIGDDQVLPAEIDGTGYFHKEKTLIVLQSKRKGDKEKFLVLTADPNNFVSLISQCKAKVITPVDSAEDRRRLDMLTTGAPIAADSNLQALPAPGSPFLQTGLLFAGVVLGGYLLKQCLRRFRKPEPDATPLDSFAIPGDRL